MRGVPNGTEVAIWFPFNQILKVYTGTDTQEPSPLSFVPRTRRGGNGSPALYESKCRTRRAARRLPYRMPAVCVRMSAYAASVIYCLQIKGEDSSLCSYTRGRIHKNRPRVQRPHCQGHSSRNRYSTRYSLQMENHRRASVPIQGRRTSFILH